MVCAAPFVYLPLAQSQLSARFEVAAQNCRSGGAGAFTGEVLAEQLADLQVPWVVLGHSERRAMYGDTDAEAAAKASLALRCGLQVMFCIGETLGEREAGLTLDVCRRQLQALVDKVGQDLSNVVIAYGTRVLLLPSLSSLRPPSFRAGVGHRHRQGCFARAGAGGAPGHSLLAGRHLRAHGGGGHAHPVRRLRVSRQLPGAGGAAGH